MQIHRLPEVLVSQIAAGEVIENPVGVIKELVENSIDAQASDIKIFIEDDGFKSIQVRDNGKGISKEDLPLAFESFATSKLVSFNDIYKLDSLGFRGEALSSIKSVSAATIESKSQDEEKAWKIQAKVDQIGKPGAVALHQGTRILIEDLFFNAPIRREFHKNRKKLKKSIIDLVTDFAISYPSLSFELVYEGKPLLNLSTVKTLLLRLEQLYGTEFTQSLIPVYWKEDKNYIVEGYISNFSFYKSNASFIRFFIKNRIVHYPRMVSLLRHCYGELMPPGRYPISFLFLNVPFDELDVNVHPQKREVHFVNENYVHEFLRRAIRNSIEGEGSIPIQKLYNHKKQIFKSTSYVDSEKFDFTLPIAAIAEENYSDGSLLRDTTKPDNEIPITSIAKMPEMAHARLYKTFVLASSDEGIFLIDQHTAHERINYELFLKKLEKTSDVSQRLLSPLGLALSPAQKSLVTHHTKILQTLGFTIEDMGPAGLALIAVPFYLQTAEEEKAFSIAMDLLENSDENTLNEKVLFDELAKSLACRSSIRKGDDTSIENLSLLIEKLKDCNNPGRCPHGRPTMVFLGRDEIFTLFKRKPS